MDQAQNQKRLGFKKLFRWIVGTGFAAFLASLAFAIFSYNFVGRLMLEALLPSRSFPPLPHDYELITGAAALIMAALALFYEEIKEVQDDTSSILHQVRGIMDEGESNRRFEPLVHRSDDLMVPIKVSNFNNFLTYAPFYVAEELKFLKLERLDTALSHSADDLTAVRKVVEGLSDFAITDPIYCCYDGATSSNARIVSPFLNKMAVWAMSKHPLEYYSSPGFHSKTVTVFTYPKSSTAGVLADKWISEQPFGENAKLKCAPLQKGEEFRQYLERLFSCRDGVEPDIFFVTEPEATWLEGSWLSTPRNKGRLLNGSYPHRNRLQQAKKPFLFTAIISSETIIERHPYIIRRFVKAIRGALLYIHSLPPLVDGAQLSGEWKLVVEAVRQNIARGYPAEFNEIPDHVLATIIHDLRTNEYFPKSLAMDNDVKQSFINSCTTRGRAYDEQAKLTISNATVKWGF